MHASVVEPLIHLVAELLANATEYSPPRTSVLVTVRTVQRGAVIEVDDGGLGLDEYRLGHAREIVSGRRLLGVGEVGEIPQTGFAVVGRFAHRHGFQVDLGPSPYGGVRAVVLVPLDVLETPGARRDPPRPPPAAPRPSPGPGARRRRRPRPPRETPPAGPRLTPAPAPLPARGRPGARRRGARRAAGPRPGHPRGGRRLDGRLLRRRPRRAGPAARRAHRPPPARFRRSPRRTALTMTYVENPEQRAWMIADVATVPGVRQVIVFSGDGLLLAKSDSAWTGTPPTGSPPTAPACSPSAGAWAGSTARRAAPSTSRWSSSRAASSSCAAPGGAHLAVLTGPVVDPKLVARQMQAQVLKIGAGNLSSPPRQEPTR